MPRLGRILKLAGAVVAYAAYVYVAAVRGVPAARRRRAAKRAARQRSLRGVPPSNR